MTMNIAKDDTGVFSDTQIISGVSDGRLSIVPFNMKQLSTSSYDVRLGENFYREQEPELPGDVFNILDPEHVGRVWGKPQVARTAADLGIDHLKGINEEDLVIMLGPGETILAHTEEFIGARHSGTTMMKARSSLGRSFVLVCKCAGWGDIGYTNRWTMEITNVSRHYRIPLVVGMRIAQIAFFHSGRLLSGDYTERGNYQQSDNVESLINNWSPESMLPKTRK